MRAKPKAIREGVIRAKAGGKSFEEVAAMYAVPVGTVKTWWNRYRGALRVVGGGLPEASGVRSSSGNHGKQRPTMANDRQLCGASDETPVTLGKRGGDETVHRGLKACHMPGRKGGKKLTFAMFKRGMWPPAVWKVPSGLVGGELLMMLQERASMNQKGMAAKNAKGRKKGDSSGSEPESGPPIGGGNGSGFEFFAADVPAPRSGPAMYRGVTREDMLGKSAWERSLNFRNLRNGTYPPRCWKIPGWLEGESLVEAIRKANEAKGRKSRAAARQTIAGSPQGERERINARPHL